ncbi:MAG: helix-turn-helix domain-containing protein [Pseudohongiellaceae bacterium]
MHSNDWLHSSIEYIEANLRNRISPSTLAADSGHSLRNFQRLFRDRTAENVMEYVRGRRLTEAMIAIVESKRSILDIALDFQFESQQSFTRAFRARFQFPPKRFRENGVTDHPSMKFRFSADYLQMIERRAITLDPAIIKMKPAFYIGLPIGVDINAFNKPEPVRGTAAFLSEFRERRHEIASPSVTNLADGELLVSYRAFRASTNGKDKLVVLAAVQVASKVHPPHGMQLLSAPSTMAAVFDYVGTLDNYWLASYYIGGCWLPRSRYWSGDAPILQYVQAVEGQTGSYKFRFIIPVRSRFPSLVNRWWG